MPPAAGRLDDAFAIARLLVEAGVSVRMAKRAVDSLASGSPAYLEGSLHDRAALTKKLKSRQIEVRQLQGRRIDVKKLRARLGISQEDFAGRYGLDVATVRNWEQGRTAPDGPAARLLQLIDRDPDKVLEMLVS